MVICAWTARSLRLWFGVRALGALVLMLNELEPLSRSPTDVLLFVLLTTAACFADVWVRRERVLLGNLGVSLPTLGVVSAIPALMAEACLWAAVAVVS